MAKIKRKQLFVDPQVQGTILKRLFVYWLFCVLFVTVPLIILQTLVEPESLFYQQLIGVGIRHWPVFTTMIVLLPFVMYDALKVSNRFTGPIYRLRRELFRFSSGDEFQPVCLRQDDFWGDLAAQVNHLVARLETAEKQIAKLNPDECPDLAEPSLKA